MTLSNSPTRCHADSWTTGFSRDRAPMPKALKPVAGSKRSATAGNQSNEESVEPTVRYLVADNRD